MPVFLTVVFESLILCLVGRGFAGRASRARRDGAGTPHESCQGHRRTEAGKVISRHRMRDFVHVVVGVN
jgi:hypothetical protein